MDRPLSIHKAVKQGTEEDVNVALARGGVKAISKKDENGHTALHIAARIGRTAVAKALIDKGANANAEDKAGRTPLHLASANGQTELVHMLIQNGADATRCDQAGRKPIDVVCSTVTDKRRRHAIVGLLSLAALKDMRRSGASPETEGIALQSILDNRQMLLDRRLYVRDRRSRSGTDSWGSPTSATTSESLAFRADNFGYSAYDCTELNAYTLVDIYDGTSFLNEDVRHSASHLRVREPLRGKHNEDIPYVNAWGN